jgi:hypothetical protein
MGMITVLKYISWACLFACTSLGAYLYDPRWTILLLPPFIMHWFRDNSVEDLMTLPVIRLLTFPLRALGLSDYRPLLAFAGIAGGMAVNFFFYKV